MPDTADRQGRPGAVVQLCAVSQQQGLGEGKHILRQAPPENILHSLCQPLGKEPQASRLSRLHRRGRLGRGPEENTGGGSIAGFLLPAGQGQPEPELPCQPVSGLHRSVLFQVCHQGIALSLQVDPALHLLTVVRLLPIVQSQNFRRTGLAVQNVQGRIKPGLDQLHPAPGGSHSQQHRRRNRKPGPPPGSQRSQGPQSQKHKPKPRTRAPKHGGEPQHAQGKAQGKPSQLSHSFAPFGAIIPRSILLRYW